MLPDLGKVTFCSRYPTYLGSVFPSHQPSYMLRLLLWGCVGPSVVVGSSMWVVWYAWLARGQVVFHAYLVLRLPAAGCVDCWLWLVEPGQDCRALRGPRPSTGSLVDGVRVRKAPILLPAHWWAEPVLALVLACWQEELEFIAGPRNPRTGVALVGDWGRSGGFALVPNTIGSRIWGAPKLMLAF